MSVPGKNPHKDPRSTCSSCRFWASDDDVQGECFRHAPQPTVVDQRPDARPWTVWPLTHATDVCGDYEVEP